MPFFKYLFLKTIFNKKYALVYLNETVILIMQAHKKKNTFIIDQTTIIENHIIGKDTFITNKKINNPTNLNTMVNTAINTLNIQNAPIIIYSSLTNSPTTTLQIALCLSKNTNKLHCITPITQISCSIMKHNICTIPINIKNNLLSQLTLQTKQARVYQSLLITVVIIMLPLMYFKLKDNTSFHTPIYKNNYHNSEKIPETNKQALLLNKKTLITNNTALTQHIKTINNVIYTNKLPYNVLMMTTSNIPKDIVFEKWHLHKAKGLQKSTTSPHLKKKSACKDNIYIIDIHGYGKSYRLINNFIKKLIKKLKPIHITFKHIHKKTPPINTMSISQNKTPSNTKFFSITLSINEIALLAQK